MNSEFIPHLSFLCLNKSKDNENELDPKNERTIKIEKVTNLLQYSMFYMDFKFDKI